MPALPDFNAKSLGAAAVAIVAALGAGTYLGWTVEPEALTDCRVNQARMEVEVEHGTANLQECREALETLFDAIGDQP